MKILIDGRVIGEKISGIGRYTQDLIRAIATSSDPHSFTLLFQSDAIRRRTLGSSDGRFRTLLAKPRRLAEDPAVRGVLKDIQIYHSPDIDWQPLFAPWRDPAIRFVVTIHDLIPLVVPGYAPKALKAKFPFVTRSVYRGNVARAKRIVVPSTCTAHDIVRELGVNREQVTVIHHGARPEYAPEGKPLARTPRILFVSRPDPYKNLPLLIDAYAQVLNQRADAILQVVADQDHRYPEARNRARALGIEDRIEWSGQVDSDALPEVYRQARVLAFPSRYEGFGLPVLEAMACGTPVVCSDSSSLPEVVGDAALLCPVDNVRSLTTALLRVLNDDALAADLRTRGLARARQFTWSKAAEQTIAVYESAGA